MVFQIIDENLDGILRLLGQQVDVSAQEAREGIGVRFQVSKRLLVILTGDREVCVHLVECRMLAFKVSLTSIVFGVNMLMGLSVLVSLCVSNVVADVVSDSLIISMEQVQNVDLALEDYIGRYGHEPAEILVNVDGDLLPLDSHFLKLY